MSRRLRTINLAFACVLIVGCSGSGDDAPPPGNGQEGRQSGPVEIRYMRWADPSELEATRAALDRFGELNPDIEVKLEYASWGQYHSKLQTLIAGREAPDVFALSGAWFHDLRLRGVLADLNPFIDADPSVDLLDFFQAPVDLFRHGDALYGLPRDFNMVALFYNKDLFDEASVSYPDSTWTWDDLRRNATRLTRDTDGNGKPDRWGFQVANDMEVGWANFVYQNEGRILDEPREKCLLDSPEALEALEFLREMVHDDRVSPSPLDLESLSGTPFRNGRIAMIISGSWTLARLDATEGFRYGVAPLPRGRVRAAVANGVSHAIAASSKRPQAAWRLAAFLSGEEGQRLLAHSGTSIPARRDVAHSPDFLGSGESEVDRRVFLDQMAVARTLPFTPAVARWGEVVLKGMEEIWLGDMSPHDAMIGVVRRVNVILARARVETENDR